MYSFLFSIPTFLILIIAFILLSKSTKTNPQKIKYHLWTQVICGALTLLVLLIENHDIDDLVYVAIYSVCYLGTGLFLWNRFLKKNLPIAIS